MSDFSDWKRVKIRKPHVCNGCLSVTMLKGAEVMRGEGVFDDSWFRVYLCDQCDQYLAENGDDFQDGWSDGEIGEARRKSGWEPATNKTAS